jgi:hypothetical protein
MVLFTISLSGINWSYAGKVFACRISLGKWAPYTGDDWVLVQKYRSLDDLEDEIKRSLFRLAVYDVFRYLYDHLFLKYVLNDSLFSNTSFVWFYQLANQYLFVFFFCFRNVYRFPITLLISFFHVINKFYSKPTSDQCREKAYIGIAHPFVNTFIKGHRQSFSWNS